jgi:translation machinery-associated protein 16
MNVSSGDKTGFLFHALPPDVEALALEHIHELIQTVWLTRHDEEIEEEQARRKKNRPPSVKEVRLQNLRAAEVEEYRTGLG